LLPYIQRLLNAFQRITRVWLRRAGLPRKRCYGTHGGRRCLRLQILALRDLQRKSRAASSIRIHPVKPAPTISVHSNCSTRRVCRRGLGTERRQATGNQAVYCTRGGGCRRADVPLLQEQHRVIGEHCAELIPLLLALEAIIAQSPTGDLTFLATESGRPLRSGDSFGNWFRDACREAGLPDRSPHGLRKAGATFAAENGATAHQLMAIYGWVTLAQAERYTRVAEWSA
jgi:hypothetical protein